VTDWTLSNPNCWLPLLVPKEVGLDAACPLLLAVQPACHALQTGMGL
jgi:hypothetical protein